MRERRRHHPAREHPGDLLHEAHQWSGAHVTFDRISDVSRRCPNCDGVVLRPLGPGVVCGTCGRLWIVREMLQQETGHVGGYEAA
jgi:ribosomal protein S27AE